MTDIPNSLVGHEDAYPCSWPTSELGISLIKMLLASST